jgi:hypothetical protein
MDEHDWLTEADSYVLLEFLGDRASARKLRLWACACCRSVWHMLDERSRRAVEVAEHFANGQATDADLAAAHAAATEACRTIRGSGPQDVYNARWAASDAVLAVAADIAEAALTMTNLSYGPPVIPGTAPLLRCVFGNPFRPLVLDRAWLTPTVVALGQAAYDERLLPSGELDHDRLLILADALEEAGAVGEVLDHLRSAGPHVRGCFAVDTLLGKE